MAKNNAINNEAQQLTIDPGASGDSFVQFDINGTGEFRIGVDDDASDAFKISQGSALGTNDTFIMTAAGENTKPLQPAFLARVNSTITNVTGDGTAYTIVYDTEVFDQNGDFNGTTTFTAPVTGKYELNYASELSDLTSSHTEGIWQIVTSNRTYEITFNPWTIANGTPSTTACAFISSLADMDTSDTATVTIQVNNGTKVIDIFGSASVAYNTFSGTLIC